MTREETIRFFDDHQRAWDARDADALTRSHRADGTIISPIFRTVHGAAEIRESYQSLFATFPDWTFLNHQLVVDGDTVARPFVVAATHSGELMGVPGSGRRFDIDGVKLFEMKDGLIAFERRHYDFTGMLMQLGVLRAKPARP
jgi:steroid delta-isomerase-like uncharacterized protein